MPNLTHLTARPKQKETEYRLQTPRTHVSWDIVSKSRAKALHRPCFQYKSLGEPAREHHSLIVHVFENVRRKRASHRGGRPGRGRQLPVLWTGTQALHRLHCLQTGTDGLRTVTASVKPVTVGGSVVNSTPRTFVADIAQDIGISAVFPTNGFIMKTIYWYSRRILRHQICLAK